MKNTETYKLYTWLKENGVKDVFISECFDFGYDEKRNYPSITIEDMSTKNISKFWDMPKKGDYDILLTRGDGAFMFEIRRKSDKKELI